MNFEDRCRIIINQVLAREARFGRSALTADPDKPGRWISDDARWLAFVVRGHLADGQALAGEDGDGAWDLFQLHCYGQLRLTAHIQDDEVILRLYQPGPWERIFFPVDLPDAAPLLPGGYAGAQFMAQGAEANARVSM